MIFEKPKAKDVCIYAHHKYSPEFTLNCKQVPLDFLFRGYYPLTVKQAPEPALIYWENYKKNVGRQLLYGTIMLLLILALFLVSLGITFAMSETFNSLSFKTYCPKQYLYAKEENVET